MEVASFLARYFLGITLICLWPVLSGTQAGYFDTGQICLFMGGIIILILERGVIKTFFKGVLYYMR